VKRLALTALLTTLGCAPAASEPTAAGPGRARPADAAPDFELPVLTGGTFRLSEQTKGAVLLDFWATFCAPCLHAMPELDALYEKYKAEGLLVVGVSIDEAAAAGRVRSEVAKLGVRFPILLDQETRVVALYNPRASAPYSVLIGRDSRIVSRREGYAHGDAEALEREIVALLR
jgi:peroxiredoxin